MQTHLNDRRVNCSAGLALPTPTSPSRQVGVGFSTLTIVVARFVPNGFEGVWLREERAVAQ